MPQPLFFIDSKYYDCDHFTAVTNELSKYPSICQVSNRKFYFKVVGVLCAAGQPIVVFPKNYGSSLKENNYLEDAKILTRVLIRYRNERLHDDLEISLLYGDSEMSSNRISAAMFLLEDYCKNGFIKRKYETLTTHEVGRVDWNATINSVSPIISNSRPIYTNTIIRRRISDEKNIVCIIHRFVIYECFHEWGWLLGYDKYMDARADLPVSLSEAILRLKAELRNTYIERDIKVIKYLIKYLSERYGNECEEKIDILATPYFSFVWESICGYVLENQYTRLKSLLPQPVWESDIVDGRISQRPDIFHVNGKALYIFDAKYYDYYSNIPGWYDCVKQFFYYHTLNSVYNSRKFIKFLPNTHEIFNAFIFPGHGDDFEYIGRIRVPRTEDLGEIRAFAINQRKALLAYAYRDNSYFINTIHKRIAKAFV